MPKVRINGIELYYQVIGTGEPIVFTHGASWDHRQWQPQIDALAKDYQVIVWDVRGHGQSTLPAGKVKPEDFSEDLRRLLKYLQIDQAHLCGLSMGGHISLQIATKYPEIVQSLILIGTPFTNKFNWFERIFVPVNRFSSRFIPMRTMAKLQARTLAKHNPEIGSYILDAVTAIPLKNWIRLWGAITRMESGDQLHRIQCPTLILQGEFDTMIMRQQQTLAKRLQQATLTVIKDAHHATNLDNPDAVNQAIRQHLNDIKKPDDYSV